MSEPARETEVVVVGAGPIGVSLAVAAAVLTAHLLNRFRLSRYFFYPPLAALSLMVIYTLLIGIFIIKV